MLINNIATDLQHYLRATFDIGKVSRFKSAPLLKCLASQKFTFFMLQQFILQFML